MARGLFTGLAITASSAILAPTVGNVLNMFGGMAVSREVILENTPDLKVLLKASDEGYYVAGGDQAWVAKIDGEGKQEWIFREKNRQMEFGNVLPILVNAVPASDGGVLVCGERRVMGPHGNDIAGFVIRLDKNGREKTRIDPFAEKQQVVSDFLYMGTCVTWGDGFGVIVTAQAADKTGTSLLLRLNGDGSERWRKPLMWRGAPLPFGVTGSRELARAELLLIGSGGVSYHDYVGTKLCRIDPDGNVVAFSPARELEWAQLVSYEKTSPRIQLFVDRGSKQAPELLEVNADLQEKNVIRYPALRGTGLTRVTILGSGVLLGAVNQHGSIQKNIPTIFLVGSDGSIRAKYEFIGLHDIYGIRGVTPGQASNEVVAVRPLEQGNNLSTAITFLRTK